MVVHPLQTFLFITSVSFYFDTVLFVLFVLDLERIAAARLSARRELFRDLLALLGTRSEVVSVEELTLALERL